MLIFPLFRYAETGEVVISPDKDGILDGAAEVLATSPFSPSAVRADLLAAEEVIATSREAGEPGTSAREDETFPRATESLGRAAATIRVGRAGSMLTTAAAHGANMERREVGGKGESVGHPGRHDEKPSESRRAHVDALCPRSLSTRRFVFFLFFYPQVLFPLSTISLFLSLSFLSPLALALALAGCIRISLSFSHSFASFSPRCRGCQRRRGCKRRPAIATSRSFYG